jgi:diguanylate cyclase (GGDEF)-like protein/PAS domain S-box-containing protein
VHNSSEIVTIVEPDGSLRYANPAWQRVLGYDPEEAIGTMNVLDHVHPDDLPHVLEETEKALSEGGIATNKAEYRFLHRDGSWRWMESVGTYLLDDPHVGGVVVTSRDITERKEVEERLREAEERYRTLVEQIPAVTYIDKATNGPDEPIYTSPQIEDLLGYTAEEWLEGRLWPERIHPEDKGRILAADERFEAGGEPFSEEYRLLARDGSVVWVREDAVLIRGEKGEPLYFQGVLLDITKRKEAEEALRESEERLHTLADSAFEGILITDKGAILEVNRALTDIFGYEASDMVGRSTMEFVAPEHRVLVQKKIASTSEEPYEALGVRKDGTLVDLEVRGRAYRYRGRRVRVTAIRDITERKKAEKRLEHQAFHDSLTDLPNRQLFMDRLGQALRRTRRRHKWVAVLFMDLDSFKVVNDSLGHEVGDLLLTVVAQRLRRYLRPEDTLARFGGDEFTVLIEALDDPAQAVQVAERITQELRRPFILEGRDLYVIASIGIALGDARTHDSDDLLREADTAMYRAKDEGGDFRVFNPAMYDRAFRRLEVENDLRRAVEQEEFVIHYQPMVDLQSGELWGLEALVRWDHPERGLLEPSEFVPVAEESGLVIPMGEQILREACLRAKEWQEENPRIPPLVMSVNLSASQLSRWDLADTVERVLGETGLEGSRLALDVTETVYVKVLAANTAILDRLRGLGVRFSIDDFGTGYSSLSYLKRLPADAIKIDKSFVKGLGEDVEDTAVVRMVIELAHTLSLEVIAEGVETEEQAALLKEMGCDFAQGYHFSKPLPAEAASG